MNNLEFHIKTAKYDTLPKKQEPSLGAVAVTALFGLAVMYAAITTAPADNYINKPVKHQVTQSYR